MVNQPQGSGLGARGITDRQGLPLVAWAPSQEPRTCFETPLGLQAPLDPLPQQPPRARLLFLRGPGVGPGPAFPRGRGPGAWPHAAQGECPGALISAAGPEGQFLSLAHAVQRKPMACTGRSGTDCTTRRHVGAGSWAPAASHSHSCAGHHPPQGPQDTPTQAASQRASALLTWLPVCRALGRQRVAAGSPWGGHCSSWAQLHLWLREDRASLTEPPCERQGGQRLRGGPPAHLPWRWVCPGMTLSLIGAGGSPRPGDEPRAGG